MSTSRKVLGIIPARGGSKGIPRKNLYPLAGKPLLVHSIEQARAASSLSRWIVSTDSSEIREVALQNGAEVPFLRPSRLAEDHSLSVDVVIHALDHFKKVENVEFDAVVLLQPTTPFRKPKEIDAAVEKLFAAPCDSVVSVVDVGPNHPARMYSIVQDRLVSVMDEGVTMKPRQELPPVYIRSGDIYVVRTMALRRAHSMMAGDCRPLIIQPDFAVNIDSHLDMQLAESLVKSWSTGEVAGDY